jgi:arylsulfatase A-like enzyme
MRLLLAVMAVTVSYAKQPNLLFMMADQMRFDMMGCAGNKVVITPSLDKIAAEGALFQGYSSTPTCTPARAGLLTGRSPWNHGMLGYGTVANRYPFEMPRALKDNGYTTISVGKDHFGWNTTADHGIDHGYTSTQLYDGLGSGFSGGGEYDNYDRWYVCNAIFLQALCCG